MQEIFQKQLYKTMLCYLDDILIFSTTFDEHVQRLRKVLVILKDNGLKLKREKFHFIREEVNYLGHLITKECIATDPGKIETGKIGKDQKT